MRGFFVFLLLAVLVAGCAQPQYQSRGGNIPSSQASVSETSASVESELFTMVSRPIAVKYYDYKAKPVTRVFIGQFSSDLNDNGLSKAYLGFYLEDNFKKSSQFKLSQMLDDSTDCYLEGNLQSLGKEKFRLMVSVYDNKSGKKIADVNKIYNYAQLESESYSVFRAQYSIADDARKKIGNTRLVVAVNASGKSLDQYETTYKSTYRSSSEYSGSAHGQFKDSDDYSAEVDVDAQYKGSDSAEFELQQKTGRVGAYPSDIQVFFNGKTYKPNSYGVAYDQNIYPGKYDVIVSFRETYWDSARSSEIKGRKHEKKFPVEIVKDKATTINLVVTYDGKTAKILPKISAQ